MILNSCRIHFRIEVYLKYFCRIHRSKIARIVSCLLVTVNVFSCEIEVNIFSIHLGSMMLHTTSDDHHFFPLMFSYVFQKLCQIIYHSLCQCQS
jgi:hypothetical protein